MVKLRANYSRSKSYQEAIYGITGANHAKRKRNEAKRYKMLRRIIANAGDFTG